MLNSNLSSLASGYQFNLSAFAGQQIQIEFRYQPSTTFASPLLYPDFPEGWFVDSVAVTAPSVAIFARRFDTAGAPAGNPFRVNSTRPDNQEDPRIAIGTDGRFVIVWNSYSPSCAYGQRFDALGAPDGDEFRIATHLASPAVAMAADGSFVVVSDNSSPQEVRFQLYDSSGAFRGSQTLVEQLTAPSDVAMAADGSFVVIGRGPGHLGGIAKDLYGQRFTSSGVPIGTVFLVNPPTGSRAANVFNSSIDVSAAGDFVIAWDGLNDNGNSYEIYVQRYDGAPPNVVDPAGVSTSAYRNLSFSKPLATTGSGAVTLPANWFLRDESEQH